MRPRPALAILLLGAAVVAPVAAGASHVTFGPPATIASRPYPGGTLAAAIDPAGDSIVAWDGAKGIEVIRGNAAGHFGTPQLLARATPSLIDLSMAPDGSAAISWSESITQPQAVATAAPGGRFGAPQASRATAILATNGHVIAVWDRGVTPGHGQVSYAVAPEGGRLGAPLTLPVPTPALLPDLIARPALAVDPKGDVVLAYLTAPSMSPPRNSQLAGAAMPAGTSAFAAPAIISGSLTRGDNVELPSTLNSTELFSGPGGAAASFISGTPTAWHMDTLAAGATFSSPVSAGSLTIPTSSGETLSIAGPVVALPATGGELTAWTRVPTAAEAGPPPSKGDVYAAVSPTPGAPYGATRALAAPSQWPRDLLAAATNDLSIVLWTQLSGAPSFNREQLDYVLHDAAGFTATRVLASNAIAPRTFSPDPVALATAAGRAIAAWGAGDKVEVALLTG